ncbi:hypothetical protein JD844_005808, partial [Phrynosoma platyrhinos]
MMWGKPKAYLATSPWPVLRRGVADEKREPLKSKDNKGLNSEQGSRKEKLLETAVNGASVSYSLGRMLVYPSTLAVNLPLPKSFLQKKKATGNHEKEFTSEKLGDLCPRTLSETPLQRVVPVSESLIEELSQAMLRMDMGLEREYAYDIFSSMMQKQQCYAFQAFDLPRSITAEMRALVIDWLVQVHPAQLCFMTGDSFSRKELLRMERKILTRLRFELHYANPVHLLRWLAEVTHSTLE